MKQKRLPPFRDGLVHVCKVMCKTCIFHPGNRMDLNEGRVEQMVRDSKKNESAIICHKTLGKEEAVCRGFYEQHQTQPLQIATRLNLIKEVSPL